MAEEQETATIEALNQQFVAAFKARDFAALGNMFANDAVFCPPNANMITGKGNIQSFWERNKTTQSLRFDSQRVKQLAENALRVVGTLTTQVAFAMPPGVAQYAGPQSREVNLKYIFVWLKIDGEWKIESAIWNRIGPSRGTTPLPAAVRRNPQNNPGGGQRGAGMGPGPGGGQRGAGMGQGSGQGGAGVGPGGGQRGAGMGPGGGQRGGGMGPGGGQRGGGMGPGGGERGGGVGPGGGQRGGGMGPGGAQRGGGMGPGDGPRRAGMGPGTGPLSQQDRDDV